MEKGPRFARSEFSCSVRCGSQPRGAASACQHCIRIVVVVLGLTLASLSAAYAIVFGWSDGNDHPYVGMMVADYGGAPAWRCSGTQISPTVFLTAGHCAFEAEAARVWFDTDLTDNPEYPYGGVTPIEGVAHAHLNFDGTLALPNTSDVGAVIPSELVHMDEYGVLSPTRAKASTCCPIPARVAAQAERLDSHDAVCYDGAIMQCVMAAWSLEVQTSQVSEHRRVRWQKR